MSELPHSFQSKEQFDYMLAQPVGPEWNSMRGFQQLIKPKLITKAGHIINPVKVPHQKQSKL